MPGWSALLLVVVLCLVSVNGGYEYLGCYVDGNPRDLNGPTQSPGTSIPMTVEQCGAWCALQSYPYFGVQYSYQCFCGDSYGTYGGATPSDCDMTCSGNSSEICGGSYRNSVYRTTQYVYVGCYVDEGSRDLYGASQQPDYSIPMSIETCGTYCSGWGYPYFGVQYGWQCFCGISYGFYGVASRSDCNMVCSANSNEICGGTFRNSIYQVTPNPYVYIGCYYDTSTRDLSSSYTQNDALMTAEQCAEVCKSDLYFGLQDGNQCFCGNSYGRYGQANANQCNMLCSGNQGETCGGSYLNSVYHTYARYSVVYAGTNYGSNPSWLYSGDRRFTLQAQDNGNIVLTDGSTSTQTWSSNSPNPNGGSFKYTISIPLNGEFYTFAVGEYEDDVPNGYAPLEPTSYWSSGTTSDISGSGNYIVLQNDGNLVCYDQNGHPYWATNTCYSC